MQPCRRGRRIQAQGDVRARQLARQTLAEGDGHVHVCRVAKDKQDESHARLSRMTNSDGHAHVARRVGAAMLNVRASVFVVLY